MSPKKPAKKPKSTAVARKAKGFTAEEKAAMKERVRELKGESEGEGAVLAKIAGMQPADRALGQRLHAIIMANAPTLTPKLWYGMPAYANGDKVVCHFQDAHKFKSRYATLGFSDKANLDDGSLWPVAFAVKELTATEEARIATLVKKAVAASRA